MRLSAGMPVLCVLLAMTAGCGGRFGLREGQKQEAHSSDYYLQRRAERKIAGRDDIPPDAKVKVKKVSRRGDGWVADTVVESDGVADRRRYLINDKGNVVEKK